MRKFAVLSSKSSGEPYIGLDRLAGQRDPTMTTMKATGDAYIGPHAEEWLVPTDLRPDIYKADDPGPGVADDMQRVLVLGVVEQR